MDTQHNQTSSIHAKQNSRPHISFQTHQLRGHVVAIDDAVGIRIRHAGASIGIVIPNRNRDCDLLDVRQAMGEINSSEGNVSIERLLPASFLRNGKKRLTLT